MNATLRREQGKVHLPFGAGYDLHYALPLTPTPPKHAGFWFGVYSPSEGRWFFTLAELPDIVAMNARAELTKLVSA